MALPHLGTADHRLATQRAKQLVSSVRQHGWAGALALPTSQDSLSMDALLAKYHCSAVSRGLRWGEIISLTWDDVRRENVRVAASKAKGRRERVIPIGRMVREVLGTARSQGAVICTDSKEVHKALSAWPKAQGITDPKPVHYLRKCYGSLAVGNHGIFVASKLLGHSNITLTASTYAGQVDELPAVKF